MEYILLLLFCLYHKIILFKCLSMLKTSWMKSLNLKESSLIILPEMCNVMNDVTNYNACHVIWNQYLTKFVSNLPAVK